MGRAHSKRLKDRERQRKYFRERDKRRELYSRAVWEPLERETILTEAVVVGEALNDIHDQGEVLMDKFSRGSLQLIEGTPSEPPLQTRIDTLYNAHL